MYGQMTAGSSVHRQPGDRAGHLRDVCRDGSAALRRGSRRAIEDLTAGLGGMGGAQPLAATMAGASMLADQMSVRPHRHAAGNGLSQYPGRDARRGRGVRRQVGSRQTAVSVGLLGNAAEILPDMLKRGIRPDAVTDQTSAHDPANGYLPIGWTVQQWYEQRDNNPDVVVAAAVKSMAVHVRAMLDFQSQGIPTFDYGNNIRQVAFDEGVKNADCDFPDLCRLMCPLFCRGIGPFRWAALSGDPEDIYRNRRQGQRADSGRPSFAQLARCGAWGSAFTFRDCLREFAG